MIKKTLYFGNPAYLSLNNKQLVVKLQKKEKNKELPEVVKKTSGKTGFFLCTLAAVRGGNDPKRSGYFYRNRTGKNSYGIY